ncbi:MAG: FG-GAP-like repeat-containing protein, partial [Trichodesmium sp. St5_bin8]|nr:FG-GAP-like repeat-containing protein [Trichodesmium sp. St5_bin8]
KFTDSGQTLGNSDSLRVSLGDVDGDNDLDAFVANHKSQPNKVWLNDGNGKFTDSGQALGNSNSRSVSLGDVDGDNDLDAFVGNFNRKSNKVWLNDGNGKFTDSGQDFGKSNSQDVSLGDVDGDNDLDAFVANENVDKIQPNEVWYNNIDPSPTCDNTSGNQVVNGSFEAPEIKFLQFEESIKGWNLVEGPYIELDSSKIVKPYDGSQVLDLDSINARTKISQKISTVPGKTYKLSFAYQASNNICPDAEHQKLNVYFGNELVDAIDEVDSNTEWQEKTYYLTAQSKQTVLSFDNLNEEIADGFGIRLDDITLKKCRK